jgi:uncharacterized protein (DUF488 family)
VERLVDLLNRFAVQVVVDTRSVPHSRFAAQFDMEPLRKCLVQAGVQYVYLGRELGGRPPAPEFYDSEGRVLYSKVAETSIFRQGIERLEAGIRQFTVAMLCAEENPTACHRRLLVGRVLMQRGISVEHIRGDGQLQTEGELAALDDPKTRQMALFDELETPEWKSIPSVSPKKRPSSFSAF